MHSWIVVYNEDRPGHVSEVTTMLSNQNINIASMRLYRSSRGGEAVMVVECDQEVPESGIDWLRGFDGIRKVTYLGMTGE